MYRLLNALARHAARITYVITMQASEYLADVARKQPTRTTNDLNLLPSIVGKL